MIGCFYRALMHQFCANRFMMMEIQPATDIRVKPWRCPHENKVCGFLLRGDTEQHDCFKVQNSRIQGLGLFLLPHLLKEGGGKFPTVGFGGLTLCFSCAHKFYYKLDENGKPELEARFVFCCLFALCVKCHSSNLLSCCPATYSNWMMKTKIQRTTAPVFFWTGTPMTSFMMPRNLLSAVD